MAFHAAPMSPSSFALSAHHPSRSSQLQLGQLQLHLHHQPPSRLSFVRTLPLRLCLRTRFQLSPLPVALPSSTNHDNNDNENGNNNSSGGGGGGGGDGEAEHHGGASDGQRGEALFVLSQVGRKLESLPDDLAAAIEGGRVTGEIVRRFAQMEGSPLHRWLLQFRGFRERLLADELFLAKAAMECGVGVMAKTAAEYEKRKEKFFKEIDAVITDVIMAIVADFILVYYSAPTVSLQPSLGTIRAIFSQIIEGARPFVFLNNIGNIVRTSLKLFAVATSASQPSQVDTGVPDALIKAVKAVVK